MGKMRSRNLFSLNFLIWTRALFYPQDTRFLQFLRFFDSITIIYSPKNNYLHTMSEKRKYSKAFYDDGVGDLLEWIDDEVLVHAEIKKNSKELSRKRETRKELQSKIYGQNETDSKETQRDRPSVSLKSLDDTLSDDVSRKAPRIKTNNKNLEDRARGLINRLAAQTMPFVTSEFEKLYSNNDRTLVNAAILKNIETSIISQHTIAKRKLVAELMLLVAYLDFKVSHSIGAAIVHHFVVQFEAFYSSDVSDLDKRLDNIIFCLVNLYLINLIGAKVMFGITERICSAEDFRPKSVELLLIVIKSIGFQLRKDNPSAMRLLILKAQDLCNQLKTKSEVDSRIEFMMEALGAIKNNNVGKIGNYGCDIDKDTIEATLKSLLKRTKLSDSLNGDATYNEILYSANWYLLDSRPVEEENSNSGATSKSNKELKQTGSSKEKKICKALGLNKPAERTIFGALLKVSDFVEASNIIIGFGLNHCSDAMIVCIHVAIFEKKYNPFYFNLINNLCKFDRKYKMATKFAIQDKIRTLSDMAAKRVEIFKRLCFELIDSDAIPITILKSVEWANLSNSTKEFLTFLLQSISQLDDGKKRLIMLKADKKSSFAGAMRTFTNTFMTDCELFDY